MSAWKESPADSPAVRYWKLQTRHWQNIAALGFIAGIVLGALAVLLILVAA